MKLGERIFSKLSSNRRKSLIFQLLNYLKVGNYQRVNNEILRVLNVVEADDSDKNRFIEEWSKFFYGLNDKENEMAAYSLIMGLLRINN